MKKLILFLIGIILFVPTNIFAKDYLTIECDKTSLKVSDTANCNVKVMSDNKITGVMFNVDAGDSLELISLEKDSVWDGLSNKNYITVQFAEGLDSNQVVANITLKAKKSNSKATIKLKEVEIDSIVDGNSVANTNIEDVSKTISIKSDTNLVTVFIIMGVLVVAGAIVLVISKSKKKK